MKRKPHIITGGQQAKFPQNIIFFDCETEAKQITDKGELHKLKLGVARYYRTNKDGKLTFQREMVFTQTHEITYFILKVARPKTKLYIMAHNFVFDLFTSGLLSQLKDAGFRLNSFYQKGQSAIFHWSKDSCKIIGLDTGNFYTGSLEKIGEWLGEPKLTVDFKTVLDDDLIVYCRQDVMILVKAMQKWMDFLKDYDLGGFRYTLASTAFSAWRHRFMTHKVYVHVDKEAEELETASYHGGRVQVWKVGYFDDDHYYYVDVNSMYPFVCVTNEYPTSLYRLYDNPTVSNLQHKIFLYCITADVTIKAQPHCYPKLYDKRIVYPGGVFRTTLSTPELLYALLNDEIIKVHTMAVYQKAPVFASYMLSLYDMRRKFKDEGNEPYYLNAKLLMNSLYGKMGQWNSQTKMIGSGESNATKIIYGINGDTGKPFKHIYLNGDVYEETTDGLAYHAFPGIAAHVTAYARMYLFHLRSVAQPDNVFYCDTDSLIVNSQGYQNLSEFMDDSELGKLKIEVESDWINIRAPKHYAMEGRDKHKGIKKSAIKIGENTYRQPQFSRLLGTIREGVNDGIFIKEIDKTLYLKFHHVTPQDDGTIPPLIFPLNDQ